MTNTSKIILSIILTAVVVVGVGYAALNNITLNITGSTMATPDDANFNVIFTEAKQPVITKEVEAEEVVASATSEIVSGNPESAKITITNLTAKGDTVVAEYTIQNTSKDLAAKVSIKTTKTNTKYTVTPELVGTIGGYIKAGDTATAKVTVKLLETPIKNDITEDIGIAITAEPVQASEVPAQ